MIPQYATYYFFMCDWGHRHYSCRQIVHFASDKRFLCWAIKLFNTSAFWKGFMHCFMYWHLAKSSWICISFAVAPFDTFSVSLNERNCCFKLSSRAFDSKVVVALEGNEKQTSKGILWADDPWGIFFVFSPFAYIRTKAVEKFELFHSAYHTAIRLCSNILAGDWNLLCSCCLEHSPSLKFWLCIQKHFKYLRRNFSSVRQQQPSNASTWSYIMTAVMMHYERRKMSEFVSIKL